MEREEIENRIKAYINDDSAKYAVLIDGPWGCGKTYLYENYLVKIVSKYNNIKNNGKKNVYISLYGISSIEELSKQLTTHYIYYAKKNTRHKDEKSIKMTSGILSLVSRGISISIGGASFDLEKILNSIFNMINIREMIICFDDFERCSIPINELLGFINNLVEHCNCKVIILADEQNIGKMFANTNLEMKYLTLLMGGKKIIFEPQYNKDGKVIENKEIDNKLTLEQIKNINEKTFSENYFYKDIKEKVIGLTMTYIPDLGEVIEGMICSNKAAEEVKNFNGGEFWEFLYGKIQFIKECFQEVDSQNLRLVNTWLRRFKQIYVKTIQNFSDSEYFEDIINNFIRYSIWVVYSIENNKKLIKWNNYSSTGEVYLKNRRYQKIMGHKFIDEWFEKDVWDDDELNRAAEQVILRKKEENYKIKFKETSGTALIKLSDWMYMDDNEIVDTLELLIKELKEGKYVFGQYHSIFDFLIFFKHMDLFEGDIEEVQKIIIEKINSSIEISDINYCQHRFSSEEEEEEYEKYYKPVYELACQKNIELDKKRIIKLKIYKNGNDFYSYCRENEKYFWDRHAFMEYINMNLLLELIKKSSLKETYKIIDAFNLIYNIQNVFEYYKGEAENLNKLKDCLQDSNIIQWKGKTREIARKTFVETLDNIIKRIER